MVDLQRHLDRLGENLPLIKEHWRAFATTAVLAAIGSWAIAGFLYSTRIADDDAHISLLQDRLNTAQQKPSGVFRGSTFSMEATE
jgi:hypothetical protein